MFGRKSLCVKPIALISLDTAEDLPGRVKSLRKLSASVFSQLYFSLGLEKEKRSSEKLEPLLEYFGYLPTSAKSTIYDLIKDHVANRNEQTYSMNVRTQLGTEVGFLAWAVFSRGGNKLELNEFLGEAGSEQIFKSIVEDTSNTAHNHIDTVVLASTEISQESLSFLYEVTESVWKPDLKIFLCRLDNISQLTLSYFVDDDTLCLVGKHCKKIAKLKLQLSPESFNEQQLTDDGFDELMKYQEVRPSLRELDISECFSAGITSRTLLTLFRVRTLTSVRARSFHFAWLELTLKMNIDRLRPNEALTRLSINFYLSECGRSSHQLQSVNGSRSEADFVRDLLACLSLFFPSLTWLAVDGIDGDLLQGTVGEMYPSISYDDDDDNDGHAAVGGSNRAIKFRHIVTRLRVKKCSDILDILSEFPSVERLELSYTPLDSLTRPLSSIRFSTVTVLKLTKDDFRDVIHYQDLKVLLTVLPGLVELYLAGVNVQTVSSRDRPGGQRHQVTEPEFLQLFEAAPHLRNLEVLSLNFNRECLLTERTVLFLVGFCRRLKRLENLLSWRLRRENLDPEYLGGEFGMGMICASRYHWSLHWKGEDGLYYEPLVPVDRF